MEKVDRIKDAIRAAGGIDIRALYAKAKP